MTMLDIFIIAMLNQPYIWGGDDPIYGFDCSGLVLEWLKTTGVYNGPDINAQDLYNWFKREPMHNMTSPLGKGTIVFFGKNLNSITHVGIAIDEKHMLEAGSGNSTTVNKEISAKQNAYVRLRPIKQRKGFVAYFSPRY